MTNQDVLTRTFVELADTLVADFDVVDLLTLLTHRCVQTFDVRDAGVMLADPMGNELRVLSSSSATMRRLELFELQASDGPCLDSYRSGQSVENVDLETAAARWPNFTPVARAEGFRSVSAIPMCLRGTTVGVLNLFCTAPGHLDAHDLSNARTFADLATITILHHQVTIDTRTIMEQLNHALHSRTTIEQAKGVLSERAGLDVEEAFEWLHDYAHRHGIRLAAVAHDFLDGTLTVDAITPA